MTTDAIRFVPWDSKVFGIDCFEIECIDEQTLSQAAHISGHYTIKIDPLADKSLLHRYGFYYVDTLIEPICEKETLVSHQHPNCSIAAKVELDLLLPMCSDSFLHGRFHRDFNLPSNAADQRYAQWLTHLHNKDDVFGLYYRHKLIGFIACQQGKLLLHTIKIEFRGKGLAKAFWSELCEQLFQQGITSVSSSISATNLPVLNLYSRLGFRFAGAIDIYHGFTR